MLRHSDDQAKGSWRKEQPGKSGPTRRTPQCPDPLKSCRLPDTTSLSRLTGVLRSSQTSVASALLPCALPRGEHVMSIRCGIVFAVLAVVCTAAPQGAVDGLAILGINLGGDAEFRKGARRIRRLFGQSAGFRVGYPALPPFLQDKNVDSFPIIARPASLPFRASTSILTPSASWVTCSRLFVAREPGGVHTAPSGSV